MKFSIWYNNDIEWFSKIIEKYHNNISSVYFSPPKDISWTLREEKQLDFDSHEKQIIKLIILCKKYSIKSIMLFNSTQWTKETWSIQSMLKNISYMKKMQQFWLTSISLYNMLHVQFIKKSLPDLEIYSSVTLHIKELEMARYIKKLWVDIITIPEEMNRDFKFIEDIKTKLWFKIQVMLNEWCIKNCPFRDMHFDISVNWWEFSEDWKNFNKDWLMPNFHCVSFFKENRRYIFRSCFIRPEDVSNYEDKVDYFKIVSRDYDSIKIENILKAYINQKYSWNLFDIVDFPVSPDWKSVKFIDNDLLTKKNFFQKIQHCPHDCDTCFACDQYFND